jgi:hypothetical protein
MRTDFETELSRLLQAITPEPPEHLAAPRVASLPEVVPGDADAAVLELTTGTAHAPPRRRLWPVAVAAAAVVALAAGVIALARFGDSGGPAAHRPAGVTDSTPAVPPCRNAQIVVSQAAPRFVTHGRTGVARLIYHNAWATQCELPLPSVSVGTGTTGGAPFPASGATVRIPADGRVVLTAHVLVAGRCRAVEDGLRLNAADGPWTDSVSLGVTGCTLTPVRVTHRAAG